MPYKKILGLDLGTNSIGWALIEQDFENKNGKILGMGTRVIPMSQDILGDFGKGNAVSQTAERTRFRSIRRLRERHLLRRQRLHRVLNVMQFLPEHYAKQLSFSYRAGQFQNDTEPKLAYRISVDEKSGNTSHEFIFKDSFREMLADFRSHHPGMLNNTKGNDLLIPYDWTIYYLRKKALTAKINKEELAWIILNFNQKRGYYQLRGEETEENPQKSVEFYSLKVIDVIADETKNSKGENWYSVMLENGWTYRRSSKISLQDWIGKTRDFIVTTDLNEDGTVKKDKDGQEKRSFRAPGEEDWTLRKKKTEHDIIKEGKKVGTYIYDSLLKDPRQKIKGKLVRTIERRFYKEELIDILNKQKEFHEELRNIDLFNDCIRELYKNNLAHEQLLQKKDFTHLFVNDIIFYQRPLKSQKSSISNCSFEYRSFKDETGVLHQKFLKAIPKSNPYFQEFRIWQWISNLSIYRKDNDQNVTDEFLKSTEEKESLFDFLMHKKDIEQKPLMRYFLERKGFKGKALSQEAEKYRWNYVEDKTYPCNETRSLMLNRLEKVNNCTPDFLTKERELQLWHIIYSVTDKEDFEKKALKTFAEKNELDTISFIEAFKKFPPFRNDYGSFSEKAIKKLLALMRMGKYWDADGIDVHTKDRISKILSGEYDESIKDRVRDKAINLKIAPDFQGLPLWLAQYIVYDRHSEAGSAEKWNSVADLESYLHSFRQHSLRNPIVEQVITETLRVVKDIWQQFGNGAKDYFQEIHIELAREMKKTAEERKRLTNIVTENENTNLRIKALLADLVHDQQVQNVRPYSPMQQEILKIYEEAVLNAEENIAEDILKISKTAQPSTSDLKKYKLWLEQKYRSPYTGQIIPLNKLFTPDYEIEHIIPQSRYFDDSFSNKVICEAAVNHLKDNQLAYEFIKNHGGQIVSTGKGKEVTILKGEAFEELVNQFYAKNKGKRSRLLMEDIPDHMIERQLNDTRYISKFISGILSGIVRENKNDDGVNSKNLLQGNGKITQELKQDWGLSQVWNELILPRFIRLNQLTGSTNFTSWNENHQKHLPAVPLENAAGFSKKRIDHRHHALDALIIACVTRNHINLLNNAYAKSERRYDLNRMLRNYERVTYQHPSTGKTITRDVPREFIKPWESFTKEAQESLEKIIVSFKQNLRVINKAVNKSYKWIATDGIMKKELVQQAGNTNWAIRKPMHKDTVFGKVQLQKIKTVSFSTALDTIPGIADKKLRKEILALQLGSMDKKKILSHFKGLDFKWMSKDVSKVDVRYNDFENVATRVSLDISFDEKRIRETITDTGIQKILLAHLEKYRGIQNDKGKEIPANELAFTPEGIEEMNKHITSLNEGIPHQPIYKFRTFEPLGNKFNIGESGNKRFKYVEAAKGTNLFFAIYEDSNKKRNYETIPLNIVIERQQQGLESVPTKNEKGDKLLFYLSPNDLVYVPAEEEKNNPSKKYKTDLLNILPKTIYKVVSFSGSQIFFVRNDIAITILNKVEFSALNKMERSIDGTMIKENCIKLIVNRLGNIEKIY